MRGNMKVTEKQLREIVRSLLTANAEKLVLFTDLKMRA